MPEMRYVTSNYLENMYRDSFLTKSFCAMGRTCFLIWPTAAILNCKIQLVSFDVFSMVLRSLFIRGPLHHDLK